MPSPDRAANAFKALGHELRLRLFYGVGAAGEATATMLARGVGMTPAAVSYHLSKLGEFGLLEEVQGAGRDGRERWWRLAGGGLELGDDDGVDGAEADLLRFAVLRHHAQRLNSFLTSRSPASSEGPRPDEVAFTSDMVLRLDAAAADRFQRDVAALLRRYAAEGVADGQVTFVMLQGLPYES